MPTSRTIPLVAGILLLSACGGGGGYDSPTAPNTTAQTVTIEVRDDSFSPRQVTVNPGDTVRWVLVGTPTRGHNVTSNDGSFGTHAFDTANGTYSVTFTGAGQTHDYSCSTHAACCNMRGSIRVGDTAPPYGY